MTIPIGLLWYDNDPKKDLAQKVVEAAASYQAKFFLKPNRCYVNPKTVNPDKTVLDDGGFVTEVEGIQVYRHNGTLIHHFFVFHEGLPVTKSPSCR